MCPTQKMCSYAYPSQIPHDCTAPAAAGRLVRGSGMGPSAGPVCVRWRSTCAKKLTITKDQEECCKHNLVDESLIVNPDGHGLKNVVIYLAGSERDTAIHPDYSAAEGTELELDNKACRFDPRVVLFWTKQTLMIGNTDPIGHNAMIDTQKNPPVNVTIPSGGSWKKSFSEEERLPVSVSCSIHPWMRGWL